MPDFSARIAYGVTLVNWEDPPLGERASRQGFTAAARHRRWISNGGQLEIRATPDGGAEGAPDSALDGRLFSAWLIEYPTPGPIPIIAAEGFSSIQRFSPHPAFPGHYALAIGRSEGGMVIFHFDRDR